MLPISLLTQFPKLCHNPPLSSCHLLPPIFATGVSHTTLFLSNLHLCLHFETFTRPVLMLQAPLFLHHVVVRHASIDCDDIMTETSPSLNDHPMVFQTLSAILSATVGVFVFLHLALVSLEVLFPRPNTNQLSCCVASLTLNILDQASVVGVGVCKAAANMK